MKAYNSPTDELHIKSNSGEELVKITPNETTIKNMDLSSLGVESTPEEIDAVVNFGKALTVTASELNSGVEKGNMLPDTHEFPFRPLISNEDCNGYIQQERNVIGVDPCDEHDPAGMAYKTVCTADEFNAMVSTNQQILLGFFDTSILLNSFYFDEVSNYFIPYSVLINTINSSDNYVYSLSFNYTDPQEPLYIKMEKLTYFDKTYLALAGTLKGTRIVLSYNEYLSLIGGTTLINIAVIDNEQDAAYIDVVVRDATDTVNAAISRAYYLRTINSGTGITQYQYVDYDAQQAFNISIENSGGLGSATITPITL